MTALSSQSRKTGGAKLHEYKSRKSFEAPIRCSLAYFILLSLFLFPLGGKDFSCAVCGFGQVFMMTRALGFDLQPMICRPAADKYNERIPLHARKKKIKQTKTNNTNKQTSGPQGDTSTKSSNHSLLKRFQRIPLRMVPTSPDNRGLDCTFTLKDTQQSEFRSH